MFSVGVIVDSIAVCTGGLIGAGLKKSVSEEWKTKLNTVFGISSMAMGITGIILMQNMPAVVFSAIIGTCVGIILGLENRLTSLGSLVKSKISRDGEGIDGNHISALVTAVVLFCASGTGIYGSIVSGVSGDNTILFAKAILDFFTAIIFACSLGVVTSLISLPQCIIYSLLALMASFIMPLISETMLSDFKACGGVIMLATGFRILKLKDFPLTDMLPAMILVLPISYLWSEYIMKLIS